MDPTARSQRQAIWLTIFLTAAVSVVGLVAHELNWIRERRTFRAQDWCIDSGDRSTTRVFLAFRPRPARLIDRLHLLATRLLKEKASEPISISCGRVDPPTFAKFATGELPSEALDQLLRARWLFPEERIVLDFLAESVFAAGGPGANHD
jgi:hypothetical protein